MRIGVPQEIKTHEYRVGLTPGAVREYVAAGHRVLVETNAGAGSSITDHEYTEAGAEILISTDLSCLMHLDGYIRYKNLDLKTMHIADVLASQ